MHRLMLAWQQPGTTNDGESRATPQHPPHCWKPRGLKRLRCHSFSSVVVISENMNNPFNITKLIRTDPFYHEPMEGDVWWAIPQETDFWSQSGLVGSNVDWCERNYVYNRYVAEMWNCLSSLPISAVALYGMVISRRRAYDSRICFAYFTVFIVGLGSAMFHGTLTRLGQAFDELPMIATINACLFTTMELQIDQRNHKAGSRALGFAFVSLFVFFCICYVCFPQYYWVFIITYSLQIVLFFYRAYSLVPTLSAKPTVAQIWQARLYKYGALIYLGGWAFFWMPENLFCLKYPSIFQPLHLHSFFHLTSAVAPFHVLMFLSFAREEAKRGVGNVKHQAHPVFFLGAVVVPDTKVQ